MTQLIGLHGKARSGKDTVADIVQEWCEDYELTSARQGFADRLKVSAAHALGILDGEIDMCNDLKRDGSVIQIRKTTAGSGPNAMIHQITGRQYLQYYGTEAHREVFGTDFWVDAILPTSQGKNGSVFEQDGKCASMTPIPDWHEYFMVDGEVADICLVTDVRFENEAKRIRELGGEIWKIVREGSGAGDHASEQELPGEYVNCVIDNNDTLSTLSLGVSLLMETSQGITMAEEEALDGQVA